MRKSGNGMRPVLGGPLSAAVLGRMALLASLVVLAWAPPAAGAGIDWDRVFDDGVGHRSGEGYYTWRDDEGNVITYTALAPVPGDTYITADNRMYEVVDVAPDGTVRAEFREEVQLPRVLAAQPRPPADSAWQALGQASSRPARALAARFPVLGRWFPALGQAQAAAPAQADDEPAGPIGIYHSHNAESYVPNSGDEFQEPYGDIMEVGRALEEALEQAGYRVIWSDRSHLPHDGGAYQRSRATVRELLEQGAVALIDVHRDAIPAEQYRDVVAGEQLTKVRLVVGRQNPNREANLELAKRIKAVADERYPGLIKGIFNARGNYNQDVGPRTILMEFGTHETSLEEAVRAARLMAEVYPAAAGLAPGTAQEAGRQIGGGAWRGTLWVLLIAAGAVFGYLWINEGSPQAAWNRIRSFVRREAGRLGPGGESRDDAGGDGGQAGG
ncbi:MAG TPA: stage II sporulation protein P [Limnochordales bacterium]